jgi:hypothetical protein
MITEEKDNATQVVTEETEQAQTHKDQKDSSAALLGKFKDVDALLQAYNSLQAEFTRRSQRLKELEFLTDRNNLSSENGLPMPDGKASERNVPNTDEAEKERIIAEYLREVKESAVPLLRGGVGVSSPQKNAKSIAEAGRLALGFLQGQK